MIMHDRVDYAASMTDGRTVLETTPRAPAVEEMRELWKFVNARLDESTKARKQTHEEGRKLAYWSTRSAEQVTHPSACAWLSAADDRCGINTKVEFHTFRYDCCKGSQDAQHGVGDQALWLL